MTRTAKTKTTEPTVAAPATELVDVPLEEIDTHPGNPRVDVGDVTELAASIEQQGILEPLLVAPNVLPGVVDDPPAFVLLAGHRRLAAAQVAGLQEVPCIVRHDLTDPARQLETMLVENLQRTDLTPVEEAAAYQALLEFPGYDVARIQHATGRSRQTVRGRLSLMKLSERMRERVHQGQLSLADAQAIAEFADDPDTVARLEKASSGSSLQFELQRAKNQRRIAKERAALAKKLTGAGVQIVEQDELPDDDEHGMPGWVYVDPSGDIDDLPVTPEDHASCPGHAAFIEDDGRYVGGDWKITPVVRYVCTHPNLHPELADAPGRDQAALDERAVREKVKREHDEQKASLAAAAKVRRRWVADIGKQLDQGEIRSMLAESLQTVISRDPQANLVIAHALGFEDGWSKRDVIRRIEEQPVGVLATLFDLTSHAGVERELTDPDSWPGAARPWPYGVKRSDSWRQRLVEVYGYEWTDLEAQLNTEPPPAIVDVNLPDDDVEPEDDVDEDVEEDELEAVAP